jgi:hypothetical protein
MRWSGKVTDDPTEAMIKREIDAARRILREDRIIGKLSKAFPDEPPADPDAPPAPPKIEPKETPKKKGLWWGEQTG